MESSTFALTRKASISLGVMLHRNRRQQRPSRTAMAAGLTPASDDGSDPDDAAAVIVESIDPDAVRAAVGADAEVQQLAPGFVSVRARVAAVAALLDEPRVRRVQTKKESRPHLDRAIPDIGLAAPAAGARVVAEDGTGVLIGVVDTGFDLSHPMFRDGNGKLRVDGLLDQTAPAGSREFDTATLESRWTGGRGPGADENGHGTHVAAIAGGLRFGDVEGVAPGARFLLVKTDFRNTDQAVSWVFGKAGDTPCVVNLSLGHHWGPHDGTDAEERLHSRLAGPGKIVVVAAGNERARDIHIGGRFVVGEVQDVTFDLHRQSDDGSAFALLTLWHSATDRFDVALVTPLGEVLAGPSLGQATSHTVSRVSIDLGQQRHTPSDLIQHQIAMEVRAGAMDRDLRGWRVRMRCRRATIGRIDGWFSNSGFATFRPHPLVESARTIGLPATGAGCLAVASHVSDSSWDADAGHIQNSDLVVGRSSSFSSVGPTRDGRQKPEVSAPGEMITAALAAGSELAGDDQRAMADKRLLSIEGTSMAAPMVAGAVALLLQQRPGRTVEQIRELFARASRHDGHTGAGPWNPMYGHGKLDVARCLGEP